MVFKEISVARNCLRPESVPLRNVSHHFACPSKCFGMFWYVIVLMHCIAYDVNRMSIERF